MTAESRQTHGIPNGEQNRLKSLKERLAGLRSKFREISGRLKKRSRGIGDELKRNVALAVNDLFRLSKDSSPEENPFRSKVALLFTQKLAEQIGEANSDEAVLLFRYLKPYILGDKKIVISPKEGLPSGFQRDLNALQQENPQLAKKAIEALKSLAASGELGEVTLSDVERLLTTQGERFEGQASSSRQDTTASSSSVEQARRLTELNNQVLSYIKQIQFAERLRPVIEAELRKAIKDPDNDPTFADQVRIKTETQANQIRSDLIGLFLGLLSADSLENLNKTYETITAKILALTDSGVISLDEMGDIITPINEIYQALRKNFESVLSPSSISLAEMLRRQGQFQEGFSLSGRARDVIDAIQSKEKFLTFLEREGLLRKDQAGRIVEINFSVLYSRIKEVFEEIISVVETKPGQPFDNVFNPLIEGRFYNDLLVQLKYLGSQFDELPVEVEVDAPIFLRDPNAPSELAPRRFVFTGSKAKYRFSEAIGILIPKDMASLLSINRALHNINYSVDNGLGFKELAQFLESLSMYDVSLLLLGDPLLLKAYMFYVQNHFFQLVSFNNRVIPTDFGARDRLTDLDFAGNLALAQLASMFGRNLTTEEYLKLRRKVTLAAALAKGVTGEYWAGLMTSLMLVALEKEKIQVIATGAQTSAIELMLGGVDPFRAWIRFNLPSDSPEVLYAFLPRKINDPHHHYQPFNHRDVFWARDQYQRALEKGASWEFLSWYKKNQLLGEAIRAPTLSIFNRGGWRVEEYKVFVEETPQGKIDFVASIRNLSMAGSFAVKAFLDNINLADVDLDLIPESLLKAIIENKDKKKLYEIFLFDALLKRMPTKVLQFENRVFTPEGEALVVDSLTGFLSQRLAVDKSLVRDIFLPLFVGGLNLAERIVFEEKRALAKEKYFKGDEIEEKDIFYEFSFDHLERDDVNNQLAFFYDAWRRSVPGELLIQGRRISIDQLISKEAFLKLMPEFFTVLKQAITAPRRDIDPKTEQIKQVTLIERFNELRELGILNLELSADDLDLGILYLGQSGRRTSARAFGDAAKSAETIVPALTELFMVLPAKVTLSGVGGDVHEIEKFAKETLLKPLEKICNTIRSYSGEDDKNRFALSLVILFERLVIKDAPLRIKFLGWLLDAFRRAVFKTPGSLMQEYYPPLLQRPTHSLDGDKAYIVGHTLLNELGVPFVKRKVKNVVTRKIGPLTIDVREEEEDEYKYHFEHYEHIQGHTGWQRFKEKFLPIGVFLFLIALFLLIKQALEKETKK